MVDELIKILIFDEMAAPKNFSFQSDLINRNYYKKSYSFGYYLTNIPKKVA